MLLESGLYTWLILPFLIFIARVMDVTLGTVRVIFVSRGFKYLAPVVGFFEIIIWLVAIGQIMQNLTSWACYFAYAGGFAMGNFVGIHIAEKLSLGVVLIRVITQKNADELISNLRKQDYGVTTVDGEGASGKVKIIFTIVPRRETSTIVNLIKNFNPHAFYTIGDVSIAEKGVFPIRQNWRNTMMLRWLKPFRKGK